MSDSKKIKIVYIITTLLRGGAERLLVDLAANINRNKFDVSVISLIRGGPLAEILEDQGIEVAVFSKKTKLGLGLLWQVYKYLKNKKPQIVHTHLFGADAWGRLAAILAGVPVIISTEHNINLSESWLKRLIKKFLSLFTDKIIAVSEGVKEYSIQKDKISSKKIEVIYNGIDLEKFSFRGARKIDLNNIRAGVIARLSEQKGHLYLIRATPDIAKKYPSFSLKIIGRGELGERLKKEVRRLKLEKQVEFWGERNDIAEILKELDLFILPSLWEGLGIAVLEAQAVGVPVLVSNAGGLKEIVKDRENGILFEPGKSEDIFKAVDWALAHQDELILMVRQARKDAEERFDIRKMVLGYERVYKELPTKLRNNTKNTK